MIPGMGGRIDPRRMNQMMRQLGIDVKEIENVQGVVIKTATQDLVFDKAEVTLMTAQGQKTYQVTGTPKIVPHEVKLAISDDDVNLVAGQTGKPPAEARAALEATKGDIAEAIVRLSS